MKAELVWYPATPLQSHPKLEDIDLSSIPEEAGIYIFSRTFGQKIEVLYVGMAKELRRRIKQQFNNRNLMEGIQNATRGTRSLKYATLKTRQADTESVLRMIEKELIQYFISENHQLLNKQGTKIDYHTLNNSFDEDDDFASVLPEEIHIPK